MNKYINAQIRSFLEEDDMIAALANVSACIAMNYDRLNWAGFYLVRKNELVLGPFQGKTACTRIPFDKGVCGKCYREQTSQRIGDVLSFPGHIACDSASRSELCVPVIVSGRVIGEIDLDSPFPDRFTEDEQAEMEKAAEDIAAAYISKGWIIE
ncbi:MAG: GAF domain-containing protein [Erysipelotrichaceae bacterium]|jgi:GAF domain-containing protein|nr:GAF domain-containing protein [Erysipelotrichaceae bacterium]